MFKVFRIDTTDEYTIQLKLYIIMCKNTNVSVTYYYCINVS